MQDGAVWRALFHEVLKPEVSKLAPGCSVVFQPFFPEGFRHFC